MTETPNDAVLSEDDFDLDEWLSTGTLARRAVEIFNDPALAAEYDVLAIRLAEAQSAEPQDEEASVGGGGAVEDILTEMRALHEKWQASKATWTVRALTEDEVAGLTEQHPDPEIPAILAGDKPEPGTPEHEARLAEGQRYLAEREKASTERYLAMIALAVVEVATPRGTAKNVTLEQVRRLRTRPHGKAQTQRLIDAIVSATNGDVDVPRPTSPGRSGSDRG